MNRALTQGSIRRLARRGGVKRLSGLVYNEIRSVLRQFLEKLLADTIAYTEHARRQHVKLMDVMYALKRQGRTLYGIDVACFSVLANRLLAGLEARLAQPRGLRTGQLVLIGAVWAGCIAAFEAGLSRLVPRPPAAKAAAGPSAPAAAAQQGQPGAGAYVDAGREAAATPAAAAAAGGATAAGAPVPAARARSFWEDGRAAPYLVAVMAAVPVAVGWARARSRS
ncbi:hypothetical protein HXX76_004892 [Chlamydomonas incerta]|uniref:Histone H4 n=1 Tax=Chlamydomonas incerta TaxID=51695 RepID=A0A835T657_CHLIN|nr:hypothetical protein HXX76_004892 [Chlamydomonas incerta]|eukprot:KAG2439539.1 hypothetical protein HXX76_004892 [Chlamydomonas incerta]